MQISRIVSRCSGLFYGKIKSGRFQLSTFHNPGGKKYIADPSRRGDLRGAKSALSPFMMNEEFCIQLPSGQYYLNCWSVSGLESCVTVRINQSRFAFDIGHATRSSINCEHVFITHGHVDHCGALAKHISQRDMRSMPPATYYCPTQIQETLKTICQSYALMAESEKAALTDPKMVCLGVGEEVRLSSQRTMRPFSTTHRVPSNGYLIYAKETKLKEEYRTLSGQEIGVLQAAGTELRQVTVVPEMAYTGDTTFDCFLEPANADILKAKILITETTYIDDRQSAEKAKDRGHMHLMDVAKNAEMFRDVGALVLVHLSDRYNRGQVDFWIRKCLPVWLQNKTWVPTLAKDFE